MASRRAGMTAIREVRPRALPGSGRQARKVKRVLDIALAAVGLVVLSPLLAGVALAILLRMGRPVFFMQQRPGVDAQPIGVVKFRTMQQVRSADGTADSLRITPLGAFLRRTSLDELPQLWNVLRGEMSIVGPRPLLMEWLPAYSPEQARRHAVPPGLTGWAQINGRNDIPYSRRIALDVWYVDHWSIWLDLWVLIRTPFVIVSMRGSRAVENRRLLDDVGFFAAAERAQSGLSASSKEPSSEHGEET
jgi:sugar transferase EpsL